MDNGRVSTTHNQPQQRSQQPTDLLLELVLADRLHGERAGRRRGRGAARAERGARHGLPDGEHEGARAHGHHGGDAEDGPLAAHFFFTMSVCVGCGLVGVVRLENGAGSRISIPLDLIGSTHKQESQWMAGARASKPASSSVVSSWPGAPSPTSGSPHFSAEFLRGCED